MSTIDDPQYTTELWNEHTNLEVTHKELILSLADTNKPIEGVSSITRYVYLPYDKTNDTGSLDRYFNKDKFDDFLGKKDTAEPMELTTLYSNPKEERPDGVLRGAVYMRKAYEYELAEKNYDKSQDTRREPILIDKTPIKDGRYNILDGHSTYANARKAGWPKVYVCKINKEDLNAAKEYLKNPTKLQEEFTAPLIGRELLGGYHKYKSRRYKRNKHYSKKNKHYSKKNKRKYR